eukprot:356295-Chlamydomonas_euryale.AAC.7
MPGQHAIAPWARAEYTSTPLGWSLQYPHKCATQTPGQLHKSSIRRAASSTNDDRCMRHAFIWRMNAWDYQLQLPSATSCQCFPTKTGLCVCMLYLRQYNTIHAAILPGWPLACSGKRLSNTCPAQKQSLRYT